MNFFKLLKGLFHSAPRISPAEAAGEIRAGRILLVDVRESGEWPSGIAEGAVLLPLTDLTGGRKQWQPFLDRVGERQLVFYCAAGGRSAIAARILAAEGFKTANGGALRNWLAAGWRVVVPPETGAARRRRPDGGTKTG